MQIAVVLVTLFVSLVTALFVYMRNPRSGTNVYFSLLVFFIGAYPVFNYLALHAGSSSQALVWAKCILFVSVPQGPLLYFFARAYPDAKFVFNRRLQMIIVTWVLLNLCFASLGLIFKSVTVVNGVANLTPGPLVPSFGILHVSSIIAGLVVLFRKYVRQRGAGKRQLAFVCYGILVSFTLTFLITFVLPLFLKNTVLLAVSPLSLAIAVVVVAYAIVAQRLFDIRLAVARSVAYGLSLGLIGLAYAAFIVLISSLGAFSDQKAWVQHALYIGFALVTAILYPPIRRYFAKTTDRLLYQDAYDPQVFLDRLNQALVSNIELEKLLKTCSQIIVDNLKAEYCLFGIKETSFKEVRIIGTTKKEFSFKDIILARRTTPHLGTNIVITEYLPPEANKFKQLLNRNQVAALVRLVPEFASARDGMEGLGYIILGSKRSGNMYNSQDARILGIIANELVIAIQNALRFEEIEKFNVTLQDEVDNATRKLRRTNQRLKELDETKDDFISMASHQLRTPLTSVKGYLSMVIEGDAGQLNPKQAKMLQQAFASSQRMVYLITDLLNISRLKTGKFVITPSPTNLADVVAEEVLQLTDTAKVKSLSLTYDEPKDFPDLMLDETKIRQVIMNFIDNAIYYTPANGHIKVELTNNPSNVEFRVVDDGIGVPRSEQHHLFTKFYRAANARRVRPDGTGLGLFMAQKVVVAQGGSIIFSSREDHGSTFGFAFSKNNAMPAAVGMPGHEHITANK